MKIARHLLGSKIRATCGLVLLLFGCTIPASADSSGTSWNPSLALDQAPEENVIRDLARATSELAGLAKPPGLVGSDDVMFGNQGRLLETLLQNAGWIEGGSVPTWSQTATNWAEHIHQTLGNPNNPSAEQEKAVAESFQKLSDLPGIANGRMQKRRKLAADLFDQIRLDPFRSGSEGGQSRSVAAALDAVTVFGRASARWKLELSPPPKQSGSEATVRTPEEIKLFSTQLERSMIKLVDAPEFVEAKKHFFLLPVELTQSLADAIAATEELRLQPDDRKDELFKRAWNRWLDAAALIERLQAMRFGELLQDDASLAPTLLKSPERAAEIGDLARAWRATIGDTLLIRYQDFIAEEADGWTEAKVLLSGIKETGGIAFLRSLGQAIKSGNSAAGFGTAVLLETQSAGPSGRVLSEAQIALAIRSALAGVKEKEWMTYFQAERWKGALDELERDESREKGAVRVLSPSILAIARETALEAVRVQSLQALVRKGNLSISLQPVSAETPAYLAIQSGPAKMILRSNRLVIAWHPRLVFVVPNKKDGIHMSELGVAMKSPIEIEIDNAQVSDSPTMLIALASEYKKAEGALAKQWEQIGRDAYNDGIWTVENDGWTKMLGEVCGLPISLVPDHLQLDRGTKGASVLRCEFGLSGDKSLKIRFESLPDVLGSENPEGVFVFHLFAANTAEGRIDSNLRQAAALGVYLTQRLFASGVQVQLQQRLIEELQTALPKSLVSAETLATQVKDQIALSTTWSVDGKLLVRLNWMGTDTGESVSLAGVALNAEAEIDNPFRGCTLEEALKKPPQVAIRPVRPVLPASLWLRRVLGPLPFLHIAGPDNLNRFRLSLIDPKTKTLRAGLGYLLLETGVDPVDLKHSAQISFQADSAETIMLPGDIAFHADPLPAGKGVIANNAIRLQGVLLLPHGLGEVRTVLKISAADGISFQLDDSQGRLEKALKVRLRALGALPETAEFTDIYLTNAGLAFKLGGSIEPALKNQLEAVLNPISGNVADQIEQASKVWLASQATNMIGGEAGALIQYLETARIEHLRPLGSGPVKLGTGFYLAYRKEDRGIQGQLLFDALGEDGVPANVASIEAKVGEKVKVIVDSDAGARIEHWIRSRLAVPSKFGAQGFKISLQNEKIEIAITDGAIRVRIPLAVSVAGVERLASKCAIVFNTKSPVPELDQVETVLAEVLRDLAMQQLKDSFAQLKLGNELESLEALGRDAAGVLKTALPNLKGVEVIDPKPLHEELELPPELRRVRQLLAQLPVGADVSAARAKKILESIPSGYSFAVKFPLNDRTITLTGLRFNFFGDNAGFDLHQANTDELTREVRDLVNRALGTTEVNARAAASTVLGAVKAGRKEIDVAIRWSIPIEALGDSVSDEIKITFTLQGGLQFEKPDWSNAILSTVAAHLDSRLKDKEITLAIAEAKAAIREVSAKSGCVVVAGDISVETGGKLKRITTGFTLSLPVLRQAEPSSVQFRVSPLGDAVMKTATDAAMGALLNGLGVDFLGNTEAFEIEKSYVPMYRMAGGQNVPHGIRVRLMVTLKQAGMKGWGVSIPDLLIDEQGVRFGGMSVLSLRLPDGIIVIPIFPAPPIMLDLNKGEIGKFEYMRNGRLEKVYELAILGDAAVPGTKDLVKIHGRFAIELDKPGNFSAKGQLLVLSSIDLATAKVRIGFDPPKLEGNLDIGGPVSSYLSGTGSILVNPAGLYSKANLRILGLITSDTTIVFDNGKKSVLLDVRQKIIEPEVDFHFDSGDNFSNPELTGKLRLTICGEDLSDMSLNQNRSRLKGAFSVLGFRMRFVVPSLDPKHLNEGMLRDLIKNLLSPDFKDLDKALSELLKGNVSLNPFAGFGPGGDGFDGGSGQGGEGGEGGNPGGGNAGGGRADARNVGTVSGKSPVPGDVQPDQAGDPGISGGTSLGETVRQAKLGEPAFNFRVDGERLYFVPNAELVQAANWPGIKADEALPIWAPANGEYPLRMQSVAGWRPPGIIVAGGVVPAWTLRNRNEGLAAPNEVEKKLSWIAQAQPIKAGSLHGWATVLALGDQEYARQGWIDTTNLGWGTDPKSLNNSALRKYAFDSCINEVVKHMSASPKNRWPGESPVNCPAPIVAYEVTRYPWTAARAPENTLPDPTVTPEGEKLEAVIARFPYESFHRVFVVRLVENKEVYSQLLLPDIAALLPGGAKESPDEMGRLIQMHLKDPATVIDHIGQWLEKTKGEWDAEHGSKDTPSHAKTNEPVETKFDGSTVEALLPTVNGDPVQIRKESDDVARLEYSGQTQYVPTKINFEGKEYVLFASSTPDQFQAAGAGMLGGTGLGMLLESALVVVPLSNQLPIQQTGRVLVFSPERKKDEPNRQLLLTTLKREINRSPQPGQVEALLNEFESFAAKGRIFEAAKTDMKANGDLEVWSDIAPMAAGNDIALRMVVAQSVASNTSPTDTGRVLTSEVWIRGPAAAVRYLRQNPAMKIGALKLALDQGADEQSPLVIGAETPVGILLLHHSRAELWHPEAGAIKYAGLGPISPLGASGVFGETLSTDSPLNNLVTQKLRERLKNSPRIWQPETDRTGASNPSVKYVNALPMQSRPGMLAAIMVSSVDVDANAPVVMLETTAQIRAGAAGQKETTVPPKLIELSEKIQKIFQLHRPNLPAGIEKVKNILSDAERGRLNDMEESVGLIGLNQAILLEHLIEVGDRCSAYVATNDEGINSHLQQIVTESLLRLAKYGLTDDEIQKWTDRGLLVRATQTKESAPRLTISFHVQFPKADLNNQEKSRAMAASITRTLDPFWTEWLVAHPNAPQNPSAERPLDLGEINVRMIDFQGTSSFVLSPSFNADFIKLIVRDPSTPIPQLTQSNLDFVQPNNVVETWVRNWSAAESAVVLDSADHRDGFFSLLVGWWQKPEVRKAWQSRADKPAFFSNPQDLGNDVIGVQRFDDPEFTFLIGKGRTEPLLITNEDVKADPAIAVELVRENGFNGRLRIIRSTTGKAVGFWTSAALYAYTGLGDRPVLICREVDEPLLKEQRQLLSYIVEVSRKETGYFLERIVRFGRAADGGNCALSWSNTRPSNSPLACFENGTILEITSESTGVNSDHSFKDTTKLHDWFELARVFPREAGTTVAWQRIARVVGAPYYIGAQHLVRMKSAATAEPVVYYPHVDQPPVEFLAGIADQVLEREGESLTTPFRALNLTYLESNPVDAIAFTARRAGGMECFAFMAGETHWLWFDPGAAESRLFTQIDNATATAEWLNSGGRHLLKALATEHSNGRAARDGQRKHGYPTPFLIWELGTAENHQFFVVCPPRSPLEFAPYAVAGWTSTQGVWERVGTADSPYIVFGLAESNGRATQSGSLIGSAAPRRALTRALDQSYAEHRRILSVEKIWNLTRSDVSYSLVAFRDSPAAILSRSRDGHEVTWRWRALAQGEKPPTIIQEQILPEKLDATAALGEWLEPAVDEIEGATWWLKRLSNGQLLRARFPATMSQSEVPSAIPAFSAAEATPKVILNQPPMSNTVTGSLCLKAGDVWEERAPLPADWAGSLEVGEASTSDAVLLMGQALTQSRTKADAVGAWLQGKRRLIWLVDREKPNAIKLIVGDESRVRQIVETRFLERIDNRWAMPDIAASKPLSLFAEPTSDFLWEYLKANLKNGDVDLWIYPAESIVSGAVATLLESQQWGMWIRERGDGDANFRWQLVSRTKSGPQPAFSRPATLFTGKSGAGSVMRDQGPMGCPELWWQVKNLVGDDVLNTWQFDPQDRTAVLTTNIRRELGDAVFLFPHENMWTNTSNAGAWRTLWLRNTRHLSGNAVAEAGATEWDWNSIIDLEAVDHAVTRSQLSARELLPVGQQEQIVGLLALNKTEDSKGDRVLSILGLANGTNKWRVLGSIAKADVLETGTTNVDGLPVAAKGASRDGLSLASLDEHRLLAVAAREWLKRLTTATLGESLETPLLEDLEIGRTAAQIGLIGKYKGEDRWNVWRNSGMYRVALDQRGITNDQDARAVLKFEGMPPLAQRGTPETARDAMRNLASIELPAQSLMEGVFLPGSGGNAGLLVETVGEGRLWGVEREGNICQLGKGNSIVALDQLALVRDLLFGRSLPQDASVTISGVVLDGGRATVVRNHPDFPGRVIAALPLPQNRTIIAIIPEFDTRTGELSESTVLDAILREAMVAHTPRKSFAVCALPNRTLIFVRERELGIWNSGVGKFVPGGMIELKTAEILSKASTSIGNSVLLSSLMTDAKSPDSIAITGGPLSADFIRQPIGVTMQAFVDSVIKYPGAKIMNELLVPEGFLAQTKEGQALIYAPAWFSAEIRVFPSLSQLTEIAYAAAVSEHEEVDAALKKPDWFATWLRARLQDGTASDALGTILWPPARP